MARANRHYIPGCVWHITHRCHKKEFLLRIKAIGREVRGTDGVYELRECDGSYNGNFAGENGRLRPENTYFLNISVWFLMTKLGPTLPPQPRKITGSNR